MATDEFESRYLGTWWRVSEEDTPGLMTYRKDGAALPPSRGGRTGFTLHKLGRASLIRTGPDDRQQNTESHWHLDSKGQLFVEGSGDPVGAIAELQGDRLLLRR